MDSTLLRTCAPFLFLLALPLARTSAQDLAAAQAATGVLLVDGRLQAVGPDYRARFDQAGVVFEPALGRAAPDTQSWCYTWESVRRGAQTLWSDDAAGAAPAADSEAKAVRYHRAPGLVEVYEARREGIEQSFVFAQRPTGTGDLVVRGRIRSSMVLQSHDEGTGLHYELAGVGGVRVGGVTGVDANGATAAGTLRLDGDHVEYTLPAAFVDHAAYPMVLDPLIGSAFAIGDGPGIDTMPSAAFDQSTLRWYVAWTVLISATDEELRGQLLTWTGALVGSVAVMAGNVEPTHGPVVVNVNGSNRFLVTYVDATSQQSTIRCRAIDAVSGAMSAWTYVMSTNFSAFRFGAGGDQRSNGTTAILAFSNIQLGDRVVQAVRVQVPSTGNPVVSAPVTLVSETTNDLWVYTDVAVSRSGGTSGRWLATWVRRNLSVGGAAINEIGTVCAPATTLYSPGLFVSTKSIACATAEGDRFVLAYHVTSALGATENLWARPVSLLGVCPTTMSPGPAVMVDAGTGGDSLPSIDFARDKYLMAWRRLGTGGSYEVVVKGLDPVTCVDCGEVYPVEPGGGAQDWPAIASRYSGGDTTSDTGLVVWTNGTIRGRRVEASGSGAVVNLGGACGGAAGTNVAGYVGSPVIGNLDFQLTLSSPSAPVQALVVGLSNLSIPCGPCTLVPAPDMVAAGGGPITVPLPCDLSYLGVTFYTQWLTLQPGGCPVLPDFGLSNALQFTIGE